MWKTAILLFVVESAIADNPVVQTLNGKVRGTAVETFSGNTFQAYLGIPYAQPPVGDLRFQAPQPTKNWEGILDGDNSKKKCIQTVKDFIEGESEDCLYLNVYAPPRSIVDQNVSLPVLVFIHGGAFVEGYADIDYYRPHNVMDNNVVMVSIQYRLGMTGFLSTADLECPGNNGFKDQQLALRWIHANIDNFGGDPAKITILGHSAGAASIGYQLLGSNAEGLFRGAIQMSGTSMGTWSLQRNPRKIAYQVASYIDPSVNERNTTGELMKFLRSVDVSQIKNSNVDIFGKGFEGAFFNTFNGFVFSGVIEPEHDGAFLTETAFKKFQSGDFNAVPTLIGVTSEETLFLSNDDHFPERLVSYDTSPELLVSADMHITNPTTKRLVGDIIRKLYVGEELMQHNIGPALKYFSDGAFSKPSIKQAQFEAKFTDVFFYEFAYSGSLGRRGGPAKHIPGADAVSHEEPLSYLFPPSREATSQYPEIDFFTMDRYTTLLTNFVKYLNPTPAPSELLQNIIWPKVPSRGSFPYLVINDSLEIKYDLKKPIEDVYDLLYDNFAVPPLDTF